MEPYRFLGDRLIVQAGNEPNHRVEGGVEDPDYIAAWWSIVLDLVERTGFQVAVPPLWPDDERRYRAIYERIAATGLRRRYVLAHCYARVAGGAGNWEDVDWLAELFAGPEGPGLVLVTEWDSLLEGGKYKPYSECLAYLRRARGHSWFLLRSETPEFKGFELLPNVERIYAGMKHIVFVPSNQDRNVYAGGVSSEYRTLHQICRLAAEQANRIPDIEAICLEGTPESQDAYYLQGLHTQISSAVSWLRSRGATSNGIMVNAHSDSGLYRHVYGIYGGAIGDPSYRLAQAVARRVEGAMQTGRLEYLDYTGYVFYQRASGYPTCLVELGSHQMSEDIEFLLYRQPELADALLRGALDYLGVAVPTPQPEPVPVPEEPEIVPGFRTFEAYWRALRPDVPYNPDFAIPKYWRSCLAWGESANIGPPVGHEEDGARYGEPGCTVQRFAGAVLVCKPAEGYKVYRAQLVLEPERWRLCG